MPSCDTVDNLKQIIVKQQGLKYFTILYKFEMIFSVLEFSEIEFSAEKIHIKSTFPSSMSAFLYGTCRSLNFTVIWWVTVSWTIMGGRGLKVIDVLHSKFMVLVRHFNNATSPIFIFPN